MSSEKMQADLIELEAAINFIFNQLQQKKLNHFELLGINVNATQKEIETAYAKYSQEFSVDRIAHILDPDTRKKGTILIERGKLAYSILTNFEQRGLYEKRGFRDPSPEDEKTDDAEEIAKQYFKKAKSLKTMKDFPKAIKVLEEAIKLDPAKPAYYLMLGMCQGQFPDLKRNAEKSLLKAAEMESWNAEPFAALGMLFYSEKLLKRAESYFRRALELEPRHQLARQKLDEIVGPEQSTLDVVQDKIKKIFPSFFGKKK